MRLIGRRLALYALTFWVAITVNFLLPHFMPGNPIQTMIGKLTGNVTAAEIRAIRLSFGGGLNQSLLSQYFTYLGQLIHGNLGFSITLSQNVSSVLISHVPWTIGLIGVSLIISFFLGTLCGALLGWTRGSRLDSLIPTATFFQAIPYFFFALILVDLLAIKTHVFPSGQGYSNGLIPGWHGDFISSAIYHSLLPALTIVLTSIAGWMLQMRNVMITTIGEDYVIAAQAKGLPSRRVIFTYAARNALLPQLQGFGLAVGFVISGALVMEIVFSYPGIGLLLLNAVTSNDYPLMQAIFLVITFTVLIANMIVDLIIVFVDPRARTREATR